MKKEGRVLTQIYFLLDLKILGALHFEYCSNDIILP